MDSANELSIEILEWSKTMMHHSMREFRQFMDEESLSFSQMHILMRLYHHNQAAVTEMGKRLGITNAAASQVVDKMVANGLIVRKEDLQDRRSRIISLTDKGRSLIEKGIRTRSKWMFSLIDGLTEDEKETVIKAFALLTHSAKKASE